VDSEIILLFEPRKEIATDTLTLILAIRHHALNAARYHRDSCFLTPEVLMKVQWVNPHWEPSTRAVGQWEIFDDVDI